MSGQNNLTIKEQRAAQRTKKLEKFRLQQKRDARNRKIGVISGIVGAIAVVGVVIAFVIAAPRNPDYSAGGDGATIKGVETFTNPAGHVETPVAYPQTPPAGGEHNPAWLNCGVYTEPVPNENSVHSLEHGAVWVTYDSKLDAAELATLGSKLPSSYAILSPHDGLPSRIVVSAWNAQLQVDSADDPRIPAFFEEYWKGGTAPEPGAPCSGAIDGPGKVS